MTGLGHLGATKIRKGILGKCRKESAGSWTAQGSMLMDTRNEERHISSAAYNSEDRILETNDDLGTNT